MAFHRTPRTHQERAENSQAISEGLHVRGKRRPRSIPDSYWDIPKDYSRCWKRHRRTQWK